jgi:hypothetical protein
MGLNFNFLNSESSGQSANPLIQYLQQQHPDTLARIAQSASPEIKQIVTQNVQGLIGMLPSEDFNVEISTNRENFANLLASAMMTGYFLGQLEQRKNLDLNLSQTDSIDNPPAS